jgi:ABC-2 type transport system ATP-binding protein
VTIEVRGLEHRYGDLVAVADVSFRVAAGEVLGLLGPNGAGKSTTVRALLGLLEPSGGAIHIAAIDARRHPERVREVVGYAPEVPSLYDALSPQEHAALVGRLRGLDEAAIERRAAALFELFDLEGRASEPVRGFSKGMRQKVSLSLALLHAPRVLLLDEPLSGLDAGAARIVKELVRGLAGRGTAILYCSHVLDVVERVCDRAIVLDSGRVIAEGAIDELMERGGDSTLESVFQRLVDPGGDPASQAAAALAELWR